VLQDIKNNPLFCLTSENTDIKIIKSSIGNPENYAPYPTEVDVVYVDIEQMNQAEILGLNCREFWKTAVIM